MTATPCVIDWQALLEQLSFDGAVPLSELADIAEGHARSGLLDAARQCGR